MTHGKYNMKHTYRQKKDQPYICTKCGKYAKLEESIYTVGDNDKTECKPVKRGRFGMPL